MAEIMQRYRWPKGPARTAYRVFSLAAIVLLMLICPDVLAQGGPRSSVSSSSWDFGYLPQKSEVNHVYYLHNDGLKPLAVHKIESGCACTSVSEIEDAIQPGDSVPITVTFKSGRYHRRVVKLTKIHTDDPETAVQKMEISAHVFKRGETTGAVSVEPWKLEWELDGEHIVPAVDTVSAVNNGPDSLRFVVLNMPVGIADIIDSPETVPPGDTTSIILQVTDNRANAGTRGHSATLAFVGRDTTIVTIPILIKD